jgi:hypothetical protein
MAKDKEVKAKKERIEERLRAALDSIHIKRDPETDEIVQKFGPYYGNRENMRSNQHGVADSERIGVTKPTLGSRKRKRRAADKRARRQRMR